MVFEAKRLKTSLSPVWNIFTSLKKQNGPRNNLSLGLTELTERWETAIWQAKGKLLLSQVKLSIDTLIKQYP